MEQPRSRDDVRARTFAELVDRRALDRAYGTARLILGDPSEAEDAVHDAALAAWRRFPELRDPERFEAWFGRILVNACRDRRRARRRLPMTVDASTVRPLAGLDPTDPMDAVARRELIGDAVRALSPEHREVVVLRFYADLTVEQIAERIGTRAGTVKSRLHYALRRLRDAVEAAGEKGTAR